MKKIYRFMNNNEFCQVMAGATLQHAGEGFSFIGDETFIEFQRGGRMAGPVECAQYMDCIRRNDVLVEFVAPYDSMSWERRGYYNPFAENSQAKVHMDVATTQTYNKECLLPMRARFLSATKWVNLWNVTENMAHNWITDMTPVENIVRSIMLGKNDVFHGEIDFGKVIGPDLSLPSFVEMFNQYAKIGNWDKSHKRIMVTCGDSEYFFTVKPGSYVDYVVVMRSVRPVKTGKSNS